MVYQKADPKYVHNWTCSKLSMRVKQNVLKTEVVSEVF